MQRDMVPARSLDERTPLPGVARIVTVGSGKGGVGKSTVSVNLALALAQTGLRVGLFDADIYGPNVPLMLGIRRKTQDREAAGRHVFVTTMRAGSARAHERYPSIERYGIRVFSIGFLIPEEMAAMPDPRFLGQMTIQVVRDIEWGELDLLLLDLPPGTGEPNHTLIKTLPLAGAVLVTTPQDIARLDGSKALHMFTQAQVPVLGVVENMSTFICPSCGDEVEIFHRSTVERPVMDRPLLGRLPLDPAISSAADTGRPLLLTAPDSAQARAFRGIAANLLAQFGDPQ
jgi:ATP-binding protein involved in chromosome partitioning